MHESLTETIYTGLHSSHKFLITIHYVCYTHSGCSSIFSIIMREVTYMHYFIDFIITKGCDLNCKYCTSRASICSTKEVYDLELFKQDVDHFVDIGMDFTAVIIGGEPFTNPNIFDYIEYVYSKDKNIPIAIFTNGKYLSKAPDEVYDKLHKFNVTIWLTLYNKSNIDYAAIHKQCLKHHICCKFSHYMTTGIISKRNVYLRSSMRIHKLCEKAPIQDNTLRKCIVDTSSHDKPVCIRAFNGILYYGACLPMLGNIDKKFGTDFASKLIENEDYIRIKNITKPEISIKSIKFCRNHCIYLGDAEWSVSDKKREEFIYEP